VDRRSQQWTDALAGDHVDTDTGPEPFAENLPPGSGSRGQVVTRNYSAPRVNQIYATSN